MSVWGMRRCWHAAIIADWFETDKFTGMRWSAVRHAPEVPHLNMPAKLFR